MEIFQAIILGLVEGFTEFLPISSTGHLLVAEDVMNYKDTAEIFAVVVQSGAIFAVIWHYRKDLINKIAGFFGRDKVAVRFWFNLVVATIPAGLIGYFLQDRLSTYTTATIIATTLIIGGIVIWLVEHFHTGDSRVLREEQIDKIGFGQALRIGLFQIIALIPGVSRSASTIIGGMSVGLDRVTATAFSFYLSIPILLIAGGYKLISGRDQFDTISGGAPALLVGMIVSFFTALIAINWLLKFVSSHNFKPFAYYRVVIGIIILIFIN